MADNNAAVAAFNCPSADLGPHDAAKLEEKIRQILKQIRGGMPEFSLKPNRVSKFPCEELVQMTTPTFVSAWKTKSPDATAAYNGLLVFLEHCFVHHIAFPRLFAVFIESLGATQGRFWINTYPVLSSCDERFDTSYRNSLGMFLSIYDVKYGTSRLPFALDCVPEFREFLTGVKLQPEEESSSVGSATDEGDRKSAPRGIVVGDFLELDIRRHVTEAKKTERADKGLVPTQDENAELQPKNREVMQTAAALARRRQSVERLIAISNAPPRKVSVGSGGTWEIKEGSGGLVACCEPVIAKHPENVWLACFGPGVPLQPSSELDQKIQEEEEVEESEEPGRHISVKALLKQYTEGRYTFSPVIVPRGEYDTYYGGISNGLLYPAFHNLPHCISKEYDNPGVLNEHWDAYLRVNYYFTVNALNRSKEIDFLWVHDYHVLATAQMLRAFWPDLDTGFFLHVSFQPCEVFFTKYRFVALAIVRFMLRFCKLGFQTKRDLECFIHAVELLYPMAKIQHQQGTKEYWTVDFDGMFTSVGIFPVSVNNEEYLRLAYDQEVKKSAANLRETMMKNRNGKMVFSAERFDIIKGIKEKLLAIKRYFEKYPERANQDLFVLVAVYNRRQVPAYRKYQDECMAIANEIMGKYKRSPGGDSSLKMITSNVPRKMMVAHYLAANVGLVTPSMDGMNLVAKEMLIVNPNISLILSYGAGVDSQFTEEGFYPTTGDKYYHRIDDISNTEKFAETIHDAIIEDPNVVLQHGEKLRDFLLKNSIEKWRQDYLDPCWGHGVIDRQHIKTVQQLFDLMIQARDLRQVVVQSVMKGTGCRRKYAVSIKNVRRSLQQSCVSLEGYKLNIASHNGQMLEINVLNELTQLQTECAFLKILPRGNENIDIDRIKSVFMRFHPKEAPGFTAELNSMQNVLVKNSPFKFMVSSFIGTMTRRSTTLYGCVQPVYSAIVLATFAKRCTEKTALLSAIPVKDFGMLDLSTMPEEDLCDFGGNNGYEWLIGKSLKSFGDKFRLTGDQEQKMMELYRRVENAAEEKQNAIFKIVGGGISLYQFCFVAQLQDCYSSIPTSESNRWCSTIKEIAADLDITEEGFHVVDEPNELTILPKVQTGPVPYTKSAGIERYLQLTHLNIAEGKTLVCGSSREDLSLLEQVLKHNPEKTYVVWVGADAVLKQVVLNVMKERPANCCFVSCPEVLLAAMAEAAVGKPDEDAGDEQ